jgi:hypothetical protein
MCRRDLAALACLAKLVPTKSREDAFPLWMAAAWWREPWAGMECRLASTSKLRRESEGRVISDQRSAISRAANWGTGEVAWSARSSWIVELGAVRMLIQ